MVDSVHEHKSNLLRYQCYHFKQHPETDQGNHEINKADKNDASNNFRNFSPT